MSEHAISNARGWLREMRRMTDALDEAGDNCEALDEAREEIQEAPLSLRVRGGWYSPGDEDRGGVEEFELLLSTGGPALRIIGELDRGEASEPRLQWQDWGTPWTDYRIEDEADEVALLAFAQQFYFSDD